LSAAVGVRLAAFASLQHAEAAPATGLQPARALRLHSGWLRVWRAGPSHDRSGDAAFSQRSRRVDQV